MKLIMLVLKSFDAESIREFKIMFGSALAGVILNIVTLLEYPAEIIKFISLCLSCIAMLVTVITGIIHLKRILKK